MKFVKLQARFGLVRVSPEALPAPEAAASCSSPCSGTCVGLACWWREAADVVFDKNSD